MSILWELFFCSTFHLGQFLKSGIHEPICPGLGTLAVDTKLSNISMFPFCSISLSSKLCSLATPLRLIIRLSCIESSTMWEKQSTYKQNLHTHKTHLLTSKALRADKMTSTLSSPNRVRIASLMKVSSTPSWTREKQINYCNKAHKFSHWNLRTAGPTLRAHKWGLLRWVAAIILFQSHWA